MPNNKKSIAAKIKRNAPKIVAPSRKIAAPTKNAIKAFSNKLSSVNGTNTYTPNSFRNDTFKHRKKVANSKKVTTKLSTKKLK